MHFKCVTTTHLREWVLRVNSFPFSICLHRMGKTCHVDSQMDQSNLGMCLLVGSGTGVSKHAPGPITADSTEHKDHTKMTLSGTFNKSLRQRM